MVAANLTDRALRALKPKADGSQRELFDGGARGPFRTMLNVGRGHMVLYLYVTRDTQTASADHRHVSGMVFGRRTRERT